MDPTALIPAADSISVHWGWFKAFLLITFVIHLLFMNVVVGSSIIALVRALRNGYPPGTPDKTVTGKLPTVLALAVNFGVAPLLFLQVLYGQFLYTSSILMGWFWLSIVVLVILAYYGFYLHQMKHDALGRGRTVVMGAAVLLLLVVAFIFTNNMTLMVSPARWLAYFDNPGGTLLNLTEPTLIPRYLHFMTASVAVGGLFMAVVWSRRNNRGVFGARERVHAGMRWFAWATLVQIFVGLLFLLLQPWPILRLFVGGSGMHTGALVVGVVLALMALALGFKDRVWPCVVLTVLVISAMAVVRDLVRGAYLSPYFKPSELTLSPQYSALTAFLIVLGIGLLALAYMLTLSARAERPPEGDR
jgi:hypothetical protein